jgi:hypothetical protein
MGGRQHRRMCRCSSASGRLGLPADLVVEVRHTEKSTAGIMVDGCSGEWGSLKVDVNGRTVPILEAPLAATQIGKHADDPERSEYVVGMRWLKTIPREDASREKACSRTRTARPR